MSDGAAAREPGKKHSRNENNEGRRIEREDKIAALEKARYTKICASLPLEGVVGLGSGRRGRDY